MKKSALYSTIVMIVVIVCCITAVTYSFFNVQSSNNIFELGSKVSKGFTWGFNDGDQTTEEDVIAGSDTIEETKLYARRILTYSSSVTEYSNMHITVSNFQYRMPDAGAKDGYRVIDPDSDNAQYLDEVIEYSIVQAKNVSEAKNVALPTGDDKWHPKRALTTECDNLGQIKGDARNGVIVVFIRLNVENELLPPAMNQVEVVATIESREL